jgi:hypothetical protein
VLTTWNDKSVNAVTPTITGDSNGLVYTTTGIQWNGGAYLSLPNGTLPYGTGSFIYFIVFNPGDVNIGVVNVGNTNLGAVQLTLVLADPDMVWYQPDLPITNPTGLSLVTLSYDSSTKGRVMSVNATNTVSDTLSSGNEYNLPSTNHRVGTIHGTSNFFNGKYCELIVYSTDLSVPNRQLIEGYLAWKWGFQANLPSNHPYKTTPVLTTPWKYITSLLGPTGPTGPPQVRSGTGSTDGTFQQVVTFASAFTSTPTVSATVTDGSATWVSIGSVSTTGFTAYTWNISGGVSAAFNWQAMA